MADQPQRERERDFATHKHRRLDSEPLAPGQSVREQPTPEPPASSTPSPSRNSPRSPFHRRKRSEVANLQEELGPALAIANMQRKNRVPRRDQSSGEEGQLWTRSQAAIADIVKSINEDNDRINSLVEFDKELGAISDDKIPSDKLQAMDDLCREGVRESDTLAKDIAGAIEKLGLLKALATAKEGSPGGPSTSLGKRSTAARDRERDRERDRADKDKDKEKEKERSKEKENDKDKDNASTTAAGSSVYDFDAGAESPVPSPVAGSSRKFSERASNRDRDSMPPKADSVEPQGTSAPPESVSSATAAGANKSKVVFSKGDAVAFKPKAANNDATSDWILGEVVLVLGEGKSRRYKVLDVEPDEQATKKEYRSSASSMIHITPARSADTLPDWDAGKVVLALYPNTTTFYRAEVYGMTADGRNVNLKFEGENDSSTLQQVERRFVIEYRP